MQPALGDPINPIFILTVFPFSIAQTHPEASKHGPWMQSIIKAEKSREGGNESRGANRRQ